MTGIDEPREGEDRQARALKPRSGGDDTEIEYPAVLDELRKVENPEDAERLERLLGDADLIRRLQLSNFDLESNDWRELAKTKAEYGYGVFVGWSHAGLLHRMAATQGGRGVYGYTKIPEGLRLYGDDAHELAAELMIHSIEAFRTKTLMNPDPERRWRADRGASLRTFFVGRCLMELPDVYAHWDRNQQRALAHLPDDPKLWAETLQDHDYQPDGIPHVAAVANVSLEEIEGGIVKVMFSLQGEGYSYTEIAEMISDSGTRYRSLSENTDAPAQEESPKGARRTMAREGKEGMKNLISRSSFGTKGAVKIRRRTPDAVAKRIVSQSTRLGKEKKSRRSH